jgi:phosphopantothenoylcysteine synthetase/decarboxylase
MEHWVKANPDGLILHSAAVGDYELAENTGKIPSGQPEVLLRLTPAPKILDQIRGWGFKGRLVSFKAGRPGLTGEQLEEIARAQALRTGSDLVFANVLGQLQEQVLLVGPEQTLVCERRGQAILGLVEQLRFWLRESLRGAEGP